MIQIGIFNPHSDLSTLEMNNVSKVYWNLTPPELDEHSIRQDIGLLADTGALAVDTGKFTGRSPKDRYIVKDAITADTVDWGNINISIDPEVFDRLWEKLKTYSKGKTLYARDAYACADERYRLKLRVVSELPWTSLFAYNMFIRPEKEELKTFEPEWNVIQFPSFLADPATDGVRNGNFAIINFTRKMIIIGGTGYTGEVKKGIFSVLNFILPHEKNVLSMHCSANMGEQGDTAVFFGLSGTGKTTLSADPKRKLIGDDEHGWADDVVFNFEGGCYAKVINLNPETEPQIWNAIRFGSLLENVRFFPESRTVDFENCEVTENTRVSYPIHYIDNAVIPSIGNVPNHIFFLTCDAYGVLPPISKLDKSQAMFHFISGYTAKVAGTEEGITEPVTVFSSCFGAPFLPLHPTVYAEMLGKKMQENDVKIWLVNTGWTGGPYGTGSRIKLKYTRAMINAALDGKLEDVDYQKHPIFGLPMPLSCPNVPVELLNPVNTWADKNQYLKYANKLAIQFIENFKKFKNKASDDLKKALPVVAELI